jgi:hypothetical protein
VDGTAGTWQILREDIPIFGQHFAEMKRGLGLGSRKLSFPYRPINPVGGNRPQVLTEGADGCFRSSGK